MKFRQEILNLFDSTIPFLNSTGQQVIQTTLSLVDLFQSPVGTKALHSLSSLSSATTMAREGNAHYTYQNPFSLFLVLYLLILATDHPGHHKQSLPDQEKTPPDSLPVLLENQLPESDAEKENPFLPL